jgi:hypothetical protein
MSTIYIPYKKEPNTFKSHYFATVAIVRDMALGTIYCRGMYPAPFLGVLILCRNYGLEITIMLCRAAIK